MIRENFALYAIVGLLGPFVVMPFKDEARAETEFKRMMADAAEQEHRAGRPDVAKSFARWSYRRATAAEEMFWYRNFQKAPHLDPMTFIARLPRTWPGRVQVPEDTWTAADELMKAGAR